MRRRSAAVRRNATATSWGAGPGRPTSPRVDGDELAWQIATHSEILRRLPHAGKGPGSAEAWTFFRTTMLSRAFSYDMLGSYVAMPVGQLAFGPLGVAFDNSRVLVASGIAYAAVCLLVLTSRSVRDLPRRAVEPELATADG